MKNITSAIKYNHLLITRRERFSSILIQETCQSIDEKIVRFKGRH